ncbi:MAG TPA: hypothetical protein VNO30_23205 [Kofleriaceae bacterium]|nr:hypothetical protein [Kofleriaceae bacterium]
MRILIASLAMMLSAAACGPAPKPEGPVVKEGPPVADTCCCKTTPITSPDGLPVFQAATNRMECSTNQGTCVDDVQCVNKDAPPSSGPE